MTSIPWGLQHKVVRCFYRKRHRLVHTFPFSVFRLTVIIVPLISVISFRYILYIISFVFYLLLCLFDNLIPFLFTCFVCVELLVYCRWFVRVLKWSYNFGLLFKKLNLNNFIVITTCILSCFIFWIFSVNNFLRYIISSQIYIYIYKLKLLKKY